jgi:6-phosphogluconate dehydrogenase (decarboxylating)
MGTNQVRRLMRDSHDCVFFDQNAAAEQEHTLAEKVLSAMRAGFRGHAEPDGK